MDGNVGTVGISQHAQVSQLVADTKYCRSLAFEIDWSIQLNAMKADRVHLPPANEVWGKAMFYTRLSFCSRGGGLPPKVGEAASREVCIQGRSAYRGGWTDPPPPPRTRKAGGTHPTRMLSYFQEALGDIVFVELPEDGRTYEKDGKNKRAETFFSLKISEHGNQIQNNVHWNNDNSCLSSCRGMRSCRISQSCK